MRTLGRWCRSIQRHLVVGAEGGLSSCSIDYVGWTVPWMVGLVKVSSRDKDGLINDLSWTSGMSRRGIGMSRGRESLIRHRWNLKKSTLNLNAQTGRCEVSGFRFYTLKNPTYGILSVNTE